MLSFSNIAQSDLEQIYAIRDQGVKKSSSLSLTGGSAQLSFPHETYTIGLDSLKKGKPEFEFTGVRIIETANDDFNLIYDVYKNTNKQGTQMFKDKKFITPYQKAFEKIASVDSKKKSYTVRTVTVPALYVNAIWLHDNADESNDQFLPVQSVLKKSLFDHTKLYSKEDFFAILKKAADTVGEDPKMGG